MKQTELDGKVAFIAFDPNPDLIRGLAAKKVSGIVLQDPVKIGYEAVMALHKHMKGEKVAKRIDTGETVATPENYERASHPEVARIRSSSRIDARLMPETPVAAAALARPAVTISTSLDRRRQRAPSAGGQMPRFRRV